MSRGSQVALILFTLLGCATGRIPRIAGDPAPSFADGAREAEYQRVLERYTRHASIYDNLDTRAFTYVTWQSGPFVLARMERWSSFKDAPQADADAALAAEEQRLAGVTEFFVAVHLNEARFDDFDRPNSIWRLALAAGGTERTPLSIERLGRTTTDLRASYSYLESFWIGYRVRFPRVELAKGEEMKLKIASALGKAELSFTGD